MRRSRWIRLSLVFCLFAVETRNAVAVSEPSVNGRAPDIHWKDEVGRIRGFRDLQGTPIVLLPIYTRCNSSCVLTTSSLKKALLGVRADPLSYQVLLFSIDPSDQPKDLLEFRTREKVPLSWKLAAASAADSRALMEFVRFQYARSGQDFMHPNKVYVLDSRQRLARSISGTRYRADELEQALKVNDASLKKWKDLPSLWLALSILGLTLSAVYLTHLVTAMKDKN